jgi:hypothetical protein
MRLVAKLLVHLASEQMQIKYMVNGTMDSHLLATELLEDGYNAVRFVEQEHPITRSFGEEAKARILALRPLLEAVPDLAHDELIHDPAWIAVRQQAQQCLRELGIDLAAWEADP